MFFYGAHLPVRPRFLAVMANRLPPPVWRSIAPKPPCADGKPETERLFPACTAASFSPVAGKLIFL
jgi:hypothetical protein